MQLAAKLKLTRCADPDPGKLLPKLQDAMPANGKFTPETAGPYSTKITGFTHTRYVFFYEYGCWWAAEPVAVKGALPNADYMRQCVNMALTFSPFIKAHVGPMDCFLCFLDTSDE